jgi:hypothetical protein
MKTAKFPLHPSRRQRGAALVVGLVLLVVVTVLAISGMNTATTELAIARNDQSFENAFQAAETGLELALSSSQFQATPTPVQLPRYDIAASGYSVDTTIRFENTTIVPDKAFSLGSGMAAYHFVAEADARSTRSISNPNDRDASALHTQAFYVVGPGSPSL